MLIGFYVSSTTYIIPYNALLPELASSSEEKVKLATWQAAGYVFGIGIASNAFNLTEYVQSNFAIDSKIHALQITIFVFALLAAIFMLITILAIDEKKYCHSVPSSVPLKQALSQTLKNKNFLYFIVADFSYFISITLITTGLVFFSEGAVTSRGEHWKQINDHDGFSFIHFLSYY